MRCKDIDGVKPPPIAIGTIIVDKLPRRYAHIYRLVDEILKDENISEELLKKIVAFLRKEWMQDYQADRRESRHLGKN